MKLFLPVMYFAALLFSGCSAQPDDEFAGIEGTGDTATAYGTVSGFGSIYVNGIHFDTTEASVFIDGTPAEESDLDVGMVVEVSGRIYNTGVDGTAEVIQADRAIEGIIEASHSLAWDRKSIEVLGQTIFVSKDTTFRNTDFDALAEGMAVAVSGFVIESGLVNATYVTASTVMPEIDPVEVEGYISAASVDDNLVELNGLTINITSAQMENGSFSDLTPGARIEVKGYVDTETGVFTAYNIALKRPRRDYGRHTTLEGVVRALDDTRNTFLINDNLVQVSNATIENGYLSDLEDGVRVVVSGEFSINVLNARKIYIKSLESQRFFGEVTSIDTSRKTFEVDGKRYNINEYTIFKDNSQVQQRYFNLDDLQVGDTVEMFAQDRDGGWIATKLSREEPSDGELEYIVGFPLVTSESRRTLWVNRIEVDASRLSDADWELAKTDALITLEGRYTSPFNFEATRLLDFNNQQCDDKVFYECNKEPAP